MIFDKQGNSMDHFAYSLSEKHPVEIERENDILKQRCSYHASTYLCNLCKFKCPYRKKWSSSND